MNPSTSSYGILIAALGGEGGGVLADWLVQCALRHGLPVQATSVPPSVLLTRPMSWVMAQRCLGSALEGFSSMPSSRRSDSQS